MPGRSLMEALKYALILVADVNGITIHSHSRWFSTPAFPSGSGPDFVNGAALLETLFEPGNLLAALHDVEAELGRARPARWAPRVCDLDLIAVEDRVLPDRATLMRWMEIDLGKAQTVAPPRLILPHPRMHERGFVLAPLADIAPNWCHPVAGRTVAEMLAALPASELAQIIPLE